MNFRRNRDTTKESAYITRTLVSSMLIFLSTTTLVAQVPDTLWTRTFGGNGEERSYSVQQTSDRGYIVTGYTSSYGAGTYDAWLIKTDAFGDSMWTKIFGDTNWDIGVSVQETSDGGYILTGYTYSYGAGLSDVWLIKTDSSGDTVWTKTFGGNRWDEGYSVKQTTDGGYIIVGTTNSYGAGGEDAWLIKRNSLGDTIWTKTYGGGNDDGCGSVQQTADSGYVFTGMTQSSGAGSDDVWLIKTDISGNTVWTKTFGGNDLDAGRSVQQTSDGGYVITGSTYSYGAGLSDVWLIKTDSSGDTLWTKTYGGSDQDWGYSVQQTSDGGYIITGTTSSYGAGLEDLWLIKTNSSGDSSWTKTFGGIGNDRGRFIQQAADGDYIVTGWTDSYGAGSLDVWLIKTKNLSEIKAGPEYRFCVLNSNPTKGRVVFNFVMPEDGVITLRIFDASGRFVDAPVRGRRSAGFHRIVWSPKVRSGVYFYLLETPWQKKSGKLVLIR